MRIDLRSGKFEFALKPLALGTIDGPVTLDISIGAPGLARLRLADRKAGGRRA